MIGHRNVDPPGAWSVTDCVQDRVADHRLRKIGRKPELFLELSGTDLDIGIEWTMRPTTHGLFSKRKNRRDNCASAQIR